MNAYWANERRQRRRHQAVTDVYVSGWGGRRYTACNHSADGVFVQLCAERLQGLSRGSMLELVFVVAHGSLARLYRRQAVVSHLNESGAGLQLCRL